MNQWATPPEPINQILDAPAVPRVFFSPDSEWMVALDYVSLRPIAVFADPEVSVAGFRLNPQTNTPARHHTYRQMRVKKVATDQFAAIAVPEPAAISFLRWSPNGKKLAFTLTTATGLELWVLDLATVTTHRVTDGILNATYGTPYRWLSNEAMLCKCVPSDRGEPPVKSPIPTAPIIQENLGKKTPSRTYTNLLKDPHDEALFEYYVSSTLKRVTLDGVQSVLVPPCLISEAKPSPDGQYILLTTIQRPFSYQLPASLFPKRIEVLDLTGKVVHFVGESPLTDYLSTKFDAVRRGKRSVYWRSDRPATLYWVEALDDGEPTNKVEFRDALFDLEAPFQGAPRLLWRSQYRFRRVLWGRDHLALVWERWYDTRQQRIWKIDPSQPEQPATILIDRNFEDRYHDPGSILMIRNEYGRNLLRFSPDGDRIYFQGRGASTDGVYPFIDRRSLSTGETERLWRCEDPYFESVVELLDDEAQHLITVRQSQTEPPNYFRCDFTQNQRIALTHNIDVAPQFATVQKHVVRYVRRDGVQLSATLYLPPGHDPKRDGTLPTVFWIYPEEFKSQEFAGQVTTAENTFSRPQGSSILFLLTQGYAVLSDPSVPIVGEGNVEPNDSYVEQLVASMEAAVEYVVEKGIADRDRLGIGGHSYGAFTTANVLAHTRLFQAGVARSGAYNRTLTPFGFQGEQRTFWEAEATYVALSPFTHAGKIAAPLLLIHGANDSNAGTYPMQTKRFFEALKGLGATVRSVILPLENHGYQSREAVGHVLWETVRWFDRYLKG